MCKHVHPVHYSKFIFTLLQSQRDKSGTPCGSECPTFGLKSSSAITKFIRLFFWRKFNDPTILKAHYVPGETFIGSPVIRKRSLKNPRWLFCIVGLCWGCQKGLKETCASLGNCLKFLSPRFATSVVDTGVAP
jgi:hypothetical protein